MNKKNKRQLKESQIIDIAEEIVERKGFQFFKMDDVAKEMEMSKGSIYFYFQSRENLLFAITYRGMEMMIDLFRRVAMDCKEKTGLDGSIALMSAYLDFAEDYPAYSEAMLQYMGMVKTGKNKYLSDSEGYNLDDSLYFKKTVDIQMIPSQIIVSMIMKGIEDGTITNKVKPMIIYLNSWAFVLGYLELKQGAGNNKTILGIDFVDWKINVLETCREILRVK